MIKDFKGKLLSCIAPELPLPVGIKKSKIDKSRYEKTNKQPHGSLSN